MSQPSVAELARMNDLDFEIREVFAERAYRIGHAIELDPSFSQGEDPRSTLARALMHDAARIAANRQDLSVERASGGSCDVKSFDDKVLRHYRVRRAKEQPDGSFLIEANGDTILKLEGGSLWREERWVLAYTLDRENQIDVLFIAEVLEVAPGTPGHLVLGEIHQLGSGGPIAPKGRFDPADEGLEGFDDDNEGDADSHVG